MNFDIYDGKNHSLLHSCVNVMNINSFQLSILGGSSLNLVDPYAQIVAHEAIGDNSGRLTLRQDQVYYSTQTRVVQEYSILAQRLSGVALPKVVNCRGIDVFVKGITFIIMCVFSFCMIMVFCGYYHINLDVLHSQFSTEFVIKCAILNF